MKSCRWLHIVTTFPVPLTKRAWRQMVKKGISELATTIDRSIYLILGYKVLLSPHLAELYGVETRVLVQAVKRNKDRFPSDFMFRLSEKEFADLKSQIVISSWGGSRRARPYAFTEQ